MEVAKETSRGLTRTLWTKLIAIGAYTPRSSHPHVQSAEHSTPLGFGIWIEWREMSRIAFEILAKRRDWRDRHFTPGEEEKIGCEEKTG